MTDRAADKFAELVEIMRRLRAPGGCAWDREQTHASLRPYVLEETYEVLDAIESGVPAELCEELGDYLYEAVFLAQISEERGEFSIADAVDGICRKLVRRHPHVFDKQDGQAEPTSQDVVQKWEALKAAERASNPTPAKPKTTLSGVPRSLPALLRAYEVSARAASVGFDWERATDVVAKIEEEIAEVREELQRSAEGHPSRVEEEVGDMLFAIANLARKLGVEPEAALRQATDKFTARFEAMEQAVGARGTTLSAMTLDQMEQEWQAVKARTS
jgi:MazG family protein